MEIVKPLCLWEIEISGIPALWVEARSASQAKTIAAERVQLEHQVGRTAFEHRLATCRRLRQLDESFAV